MMKNFVILILTFIFISFSSLYAQEFLFSVNGKAIPSGFGSNDADVNLTDELKDISKREEIKLDTKILKTEKNKNNFKILFVGDSMVEAIKKPSKSICSQKKFRCEYLFRRGLRTDAWTYNGWYGVSLILKISEFKPDIIVISSGTNDIYNKETPYQIYKDFIKVIKLIDNVSKNVKINPKIVIVAPPIPNDKNLNTVLKKKFANKKNIYVMQSKKFHLKLWDGIHPNGESSKIWAKKIINFIEEINKN